MHDVADTWRYRKNLTKSILILNLSKLKLNSNKTMLINYFLEYNALALNFKFEMYISRAYVGLGNDQILSDFIGKVIYKMPLMKKARKMKVFWYHKWKWSLRMWVYWKNKDHKYFTVLYVNTSINWMIVWTIQGCACIIYM